MQTGGHVALNLPNAHVPKAGSCRGGTYGIDLGILDPQTGKEQVRNGRFYRISTRWRLASPPSLTPSRPLVADRSATTSRASS